MAGHPTINILRFNYQAPLTFLGSVVVIELFAKFSLHDLKLNE